MTIEENSSRAGVISRGQAGILANRARRAAERVRLRLSLAEARAALRAGRGSHEISAPGLAKPMLGDPGLHDAVGCSWSGATPELGEVAGSLLQEASEEMAAEDCEAPCLVHLPATSDLEAECSVAVEIAGRHDPAPGFGWTQAGHVDAERRDADKTSVFAALVGNATDHSSEILPRPEGSAFPPQGAVDAHSGLIPAVPAEEVPAGPCPPEPSEACAALAVCMPDGSADDGAPALPKLVVGFGPGMLLRLRQLGYRTPDDLADADPDALRGALGEISRLLDVEAWIASARAARQAAQLVGHMSERP